MEKRLIDANNAISVLKILSDKCGDDNVFEQAISVLESSPTIDAVPVVRCKDCIHWSNDSIGYCKYHEIYPSRHDLDDWFCGDGNRKEQNDEID